MGLNRNVEDLHPELRDKALLFLERLRVAGIGVHINETLRNIETQEAYYAQGREPLAVVNELRRKAGLPLITAAENRQKVTWTMESRHIDGLAFDVVPLNQSGRPWWGAPQHLWQRIGEIGESCGLTWGGRWQTTPDRPHFQITLED